MKCTKQRRWTVRKIAGAATAAVLLAACLARPAAQRATAAAVPVTPTVVTVRFDATHNDQATVDQIPAGEEASYTLSPSRRHWAYLDRVTAAITTVAPSETVVAQAASDRQSLAGIGIENRSDQPLRLRVVTQLPAGLWRVDAVLQADSNGSGPSSPGAWRMESILESDAALDGHLVTKSVALPPHQTLLLRWTETGEAALAARKAVRRALWATANSALQDRVSGALMPVDDALDALPILVGRGDRAKITRRVHTALLATAKAQALWENGRGLALDERDAPFAGLVTALSEIACAAFDLVPAQTLLPADGKTPARMRVTLTNAGPRTVPLVALGVEHAQVPSATPSDLSVSRALAPGGSVSKLFPVAGDTADVRGIVQFISDYGAATVPAAPDSPKGTTDAGSGDSDANPPD